MKDFSEIFSRRLKTLRGQRTKSAFARFLGIQSPSTYHYYENGRVPHSQLVKNIADKCGVTVDWLLGRTENRFIQDGLYAEGAERRIGSSVVKEKLRYRDADEEELHAKVEALARLLPHALPGRDKLSVTRMMIDMLIEIQERAFDTWSGGQRDKNGLRYDQIKEGGEADTGPDRSADKSSKKT